MTKVVGSTVQECAIWSARIKASLTLTLICMGIGGVLTPRPAQAAQCGNEVIRLQQGSGELPECRGYELVTRFSKLGHTPEYEDNPLGISGYLSEFSEDGTQIAAVSTAAGLGVLGQESSPFGSAMFLRRDKEEWNTESLNPAQSQFSDQKFLGADANSGTSLWLLHTSDMGLYAGDLYVRSSTGQFEAIGPEVPPPVGGTQEPASPTMVEELGHRRATDGVIGASREFTHVILQANRSLGGRFLWPGDETVVSSSEAVNSTFGSLYEYAGGGNSAPTLVGVQNGAGNTKLISQCGTTLGTLKEGEPNIVRNEVSESGERVFFSPIAADVFRGNCGGVQPAVQELYARIARAETVDISEPDPVDSRCESDAECLINAGKPADASLEAVSTNGSKVFFTSTQQLLPGATEDPNIEEEDSAMIGCSETEEEGGCNLYEYNFERAPTERLNLVSAGDSHGARVQGVIASSEDGSRVYFVAKGDLTGGQENGLGRAAVEGEDNLYVYEPNPEKPGESIVTFIATLSPEDSGILWEEKEASRQAQITPNGDFLVFASHGRLTDSDTSTGIQLFEYDALNKVLGRVSVGEVVEGVGYKENGNISSTQENPDLNPGHAISSDGSTIVFESKAALSPRAGIASALGCSSVYEFHWGGQESISQGSVGLLSDGKDVVRGNQGLCGARAGAIDDEGKDVTFQTADPLTWEDSDTLPDIYDARIDGGVLAPTAPAVCEGDGCKAPVASAPTFGAPGSATLSGAGNLTSAPVPLQAAKPKAKKKTAAQIRAGKLAGALKACRKNEKKKRAGCEARARKRYGAKAKKSNRGVA
jgi:hypothetical protein